MAKLFDRVKVNIATTGTGTVTFGSASSNAFLTPTEAGCADADTVRYVIVDGTDFEEGIGTIASSVATMERTTVTKSKIGGTAGTSKINLSGTAVLALTAAAADIVNAADVTPVGNSLLTAADAAAARGAIDAGILSGFRNKIINGNFDIWQRGTSQTLSGYGADDRWVNAVGGSNQSVSRQTFTTGQTDVPGNPKYFSRTTVTSVAGSSNFAIKQHRIEGVETLSGRTATLTFYAKADASKSIAFAIDQVFGSGGAPSTTVIGTGTKVNLTTSWQKFTQTVSIPSISGKTLGSDGNDYLMLNFWFDAGSSFNIRSATLGQQSGVFDLARVSLVEGDAASENDSFSPRHIGQELSLCQRYYRKSYSKISYPGNITTEGAVVMRAPGTGIDIPIHFGSPMRATPTVVIYNPNSGASGSARNYSANTDINTVISSSSGDSGFYITNGATALSINDRIAAHYTADAEI